MTKYPIVLVHGLIIKNLKYLEAFGCIRKELQKSGYAVYVLNHDGVGTISHNAEQIKAEIEAILKETGADKVNLIAHSKGGLDARYLISKLEMEDKIASLTTLSTPHRGSKMSRFLLKMPKFMAHFIAFWTNFWYGKFGDESPDLLRVAEEITDTYLSGFNEEVRDSDKVIYQSYSSAMKRRIPFSMLPSFLLSKACEGGDTDGMVSVESSKWGKYLGDLGQEISHSEMIALTMSKKRKRQASQIYHKIVSDLETIGL